jgi:hypothetical protein
MHLIIKHLFHNTADVANEAGSVGLMRLHVSNGSIHRLGILSWQHPSHMIYVHIAMRFNVYFSYFGLLSYHLHALTQYTNKPGIL